ncbi:sigma-70 family RNA polymerase sigma factor [Patescibacteria group bacterium]|jgi:RNA polymerase sigma-70 factor (ECF subfamily)|nr:sigma-70 family RNA polymerase sigma factor [Patescibacteria group bacterium]
MAKETSQEAGGTQEDRFLKAFDEYADALFRHATMRLSDRERAIELVHDTFTKAWTYANNGNLIESYRPFLYKILGNLIIDEYRRRRTESLDSILEEEGMDTGRFRDLQEGSLEESLAALDAKRIIEAMEKLPAIYKETLVLRFVDGLGPKEIATLIEETENVVSVRLNRGMSLLREIVTKKE